MDEFTYQGPGEFDKPRPTFNPAPVPAAPAGVEVAKSKAAQEVQAAVFMAKQFPRDPDVAYSKILKACQRVSLAECASYEYPRGGQKVTGPSIRLAEVLAQNWGNIQYGVREIEQREGLSVCEAYAWDLETNTRRSMEFYVRHERKANNQIKKLDDPRDVYEMTANMGARRVRACILGVIPGDIVDAAEDACKKTLLSGGEPLEDRIRKMVHAFEVEFRVSKEQLEKFIGFTSANFTVNDIIRLRNVYQSIKDGVGKREYFFDFKAPGTTAKETSETEKDFKAHQGSLIEGDAKDATDKK